MRKEYKIIDKDLQRGKTKLKHSDFGDKIEIRKRFLNEKNALSN